jgi:hypothetical protein
MDVSHECDPKYSWPEIVPEQSSSSTGALGASAEKPLSEGFATGLAADSSKSHRRYRTAGGFHLAWICEGHFAANSAVESTAMDSTFCRADISTSRPSR